MNKIDLILKLVRDNKITDEEAKILMVTEKEYVPYYPWNYPYYQTTPYSVVWSPSDNFTVSSPTITFTSSN